MTRYLYYFLCVASLFLAFERAAEMYITVDEAITYTDHVRPRLSGVLDFSAANNHLLNTILSKILVTLAPYSELALRIPSLAIGAWFFLKYLPNRLESWSTRVSYASLCLFPYYISEYWSMSRGYFMSACFAAAALVEISSYIQKEPLKSIKNARIFASLSVLSSFVMLPFAMTLGVFSIFGRRDMSFQNSLSRTLRELSAWFLLGSCALSAYAIYTFKAAGEALAYTKTFSLFAPISAVAGSLVTGNEFSVIAFKTLLVASLILALYQKSYKTFLAFGIVFISLLIIWAGGSLGTGFPTARSWIPYWFTICFIIVEGFRSSKLHVSPRFGNYIALTLALATMVNTSYWYTPEYSYTWRSNYYQVRALMYHTTINNDFCLEEAYLGDKVLIYYWDDPKSALIRPRKCGPGEKSPYGFTNFEMPGKVYSFPDKTWGFYKDDTRHD